MRLCLGCGCKVVRVGRDGDKGTAGHNKTAPCPNTSPTDHDHDNPACNYYQAHRTPGKILEKKPPIQPPS